MVVSPASTSSSSLCNNPGSGPSTLTQPVSSPYYSSSSLHNSDHTDPDSAHIPVSPHFAPLNSEPFNSVSPDSISILPLQDVNPSFCFPSNLPIHPSSTSLPNTHVMTTGSKNGIHKPKHQFRF